MEKEKQPVLLAEFRMAVEKLITKFIGCDDDSLEFPCFFNSEQRRFIHEMCFKKGLKYKDQRKDGNISVIASKSDTKLATEAIKQIELRTRSKVFIVKMIELLGGPQPQNIMTDLQVDQNIGSNVSLVGPSRYKGSVISVPAAANSLPYFVKSRRSLSIFEHRSLILDLIKDNQVVIIQTTTGSGKSTQIPQYILEDSTEKNRPCRIIVAEPKRICATNLAVRVSKERGETIGSVVGYQVRLESKVAPTSNLIFVTNGVILRMLMTGQPQDFFNSITTLIIDEVHERDKFTDFLLLCVKENLHLNPKLRVIVMSATIKSNIFANYFDGCPVLQVEGQAFKVEELFLEDILKLLKFSNTRVKALNENLENNPQQYDKKFNKLDSLEYMNNDNSYNIMQKSSNDEDGSNGSLPSLEGSSLFDQNLLDIYYDTLVQPGINRGIFLEDVVDLKLIVRLVRHIHFEAESSHGILVFLPGHDDIIQLANLLYNALDMKYEIFILHSQLQTMDQATVFDEMPEGVRKIVLATNIAESSITVNDIVYVIDSGKEKRSEFNSVTHVSSLRPQWISKASAIQRMGRAGRLRDGIVYRIYSRDRYAFLDECPQPEFLRCDLSDICLQAKMICKPNETIRQYIQKALSPATDLNITHSIKLLIDVGALNSDQSITQLGLYLADIPLNVKYGKMLFYSIIFKCIDPVLTIVSILSINDPFVIPFNEVERSKCQALRRKLEDNSFSDHFVMLKIFQKWNEYKTKNEFDDGFCEDNYVSSATLERISATRLKIVGYLRSVRLIQCVGNISALNANSHCWPVIKACIAAGSYPEVARIMKIRGEIQTIVDQKLFINHKSVLNTGSSTKITKDYLATFPTSWMIFEEKNACGNYASAKVCTLVSDLCVILTAGRTTRIREADWMDKSKVDDNSLVELEIDSFIKFTATREVAFALQDIRNRLNIMLEEFLKNVDKFRINEKHTVLIDGIVKLLELEDEKAGLKTKFEGIGARPRVITREADERTCAAK